MASSSVLLLLVASLAVVYSEYENGLGEYKFSYGVKDPHTGDNHEQQEVSDGHVVKGAYTLKEADGTRRIVEYVAGPHSGFNAVVHRVGHAQHPQHYGKQEMSHEMHQMHQNIPELTLAHGNSNDGAHLHDGGEYKFAYGVKDPHTGDNHEQHEVSDGHVVKGSYSLQEADGTKRVVDYVADPHHGFNAVVQRIGHANHPQYHH